MIVTLQSDTITIPRELRQSLRLEPGDPLEAQVRQGTLVLTPVTVVPRSLHLSASGEAKEMEADEDVRQGHVSEYASAQALVHDLADDGER